MISLIQNAHSYPSRIAIISENNEYSYRNLLDDSEKAASVLLGGKNDLEEERVGFLVSPGYEYVVAQWGIWRSGGIAVPLSTSAPLPSLQHVIDDAQISTLIIGA
ncbi:MAG: AMP-binding protein, partial [Cyclobacteriaceae bacterium]|nr:AMP-binding protein [Cyclobacteriaceae bacterium]